jgi:hypothetical protein
LTSNAPKSFLSHYFIYLVDRSECFCFFELGVENLVIGASIAHFYLSEYVSEVLQEQATSCGEA